MTAWNTVQELEGMSTKINGCKNTEMNPSNKELLPGGLLKKLKEHVNTDTDPRNAKMNTRGT